MSTARDRHAQQRTRNRKNMILIGALAAVVLGGFGYWGIFYGEKARHSTRLRKMALSRYVSFGTPEQIAKIVDAHHEECYDEAYSPLTVDENKYFEKMDPIMERELNLVRINAGKKKQTKGKEKQEKQ